MIPVEFGETSWQRQNDDEQYNDVNLIIELNLVHEIWEEVQVKEEVARSKVTKRYNTNVRGWVFCKKDLVWRKLSDTQKDKQ